MLALVLSSVGARAEPEASIEVTVRDERRRARPVSRDPTAASTVVTGEPLRSPGASSADVLQRVPGVQISRTGARTDLATASLRGATSSQTPVYLAGVRLNDDVTGTADLSTVPLWMLERIEVYRGAAPRVVDRFGIGGAVLFEPRLPRRTELGGGVSAGSFGAFGAWVGAGVSGKKSSALLALRRDRADNDYSFVNDRGTRADPTDDRVETRDNADFEAYDLWAIGRHRLGPGAHVTTLFNAFTREQGAPGLLIIDADRARARIRRLLGAVSARLPCGRDRHGAEDCRLELSTAGLVAHTTLTDPLRQLMPSPLTESEGERLSQRVFVEHDIAPAVSAGAGVSQSFERLGIDQDRGPVTRSERATTRPTALVTFRPSEALTLQALGGAECHTTSGTSRGETCGVFEPAGRLGASLRPAEPVELVANVRRSVRVPTLGELFGLSPLVGGNPALEPETAVAIDAGLRVSHLVNRPRPLSLYGEAFGFARRADDLIAFIQSTRRIVPINVGRARLLGAELSAGLDWDRWLLAESTLTLLDPRDRTPRRSAANDILPFRSRLVTSHYAEVYTDVGALRLTRAAIGARLTHRSSRFADPAGLIVIDGQTTVDAEASAELWEGTMTARLAARNLFDAEQFDAVGLPLPGRSVHASLEAWWW